MGEAGWRWMEWGGVDETGWSCVHSWAIPIEKITTGNTKILDVLKCFFISTLIDKINCSYGISVWFEKEWPELNIIRSIMGMLTLVGFYQIKIFCTTKSFRKNKNKNLF